MTAPKTPSSPAFLPIDTDVLIQLFLGGCKTEPLAGLRARFGIQPLVVEEVEIELLRHRRHGPACAEPFRKALGTGLLRIVTPKVMAEIVSHLPGDLGATAQHQFQQRGNTYRKLVGAGEAYTHALATTFGLPAASNDAEALRVLAKAGHSLPTPVLRFFDLLCFAHQVGLMSAPRCDEVRQALLQNGDGLDVAFKHASFENGLRAFTPRLVSAVHAVIGSSGAVNPQGIEARLMIRPLDSER